MKRSSRAGRLTQLERNQRTTGIFFILPSLVLCAIFMVVPLINVIRYSLTDWDGLSKTYNFVGLYNYMHLHEIEGFGEMMLATVTFAIGSALAAVAGVLLCSAYPTLQPTTGAMPGIKAFTAAVFGGIGSIPGAMLGGILLGVIEILGKAYVSTELGDAFVFAVLIVVLLVKPAGLLGKTVHEKV